MNVMEKRISVEEATGMTSKSKQLPEDQGTDWAEVLLRRFKKADEVFQQARQFNRDHGISDEVSKQYINYSKPLPQREYERFLNQCTNEHTGAWNTMSYLKATNQVSRKIESEFDGVVYPKVEILKIIRIKTRTGDFIYRVLNLIGLGKSGKEINQFVDDIDLEKIPACEYVTLPAQTIPAEAEYEEEGYGRTIASVSNDNKMYTGIETAPTTYLQPIDEQVIREWLKDARGSITDPDGTSLVLKNENSKIRYGIKSLEQFLNPSVDSLWNQVNTPPKAWSDSDVEKFGKLFREDKTNADADNKKHKESHTNNGNINIRNSTSQDTPQKEQRWIQ
jgi:hypothetical protein